ncbi:hypothetical protein BN77_3469 [Rhizobium mesoamericanum STM3625]|uniref:Uncharacterized protein n=1 Tax=Rhizobium mesoamericanum STM3625 TaxID=1211777 RepID=K0PIV2_9HYPH|nr:hypothetical protein BN77_3469 [Rhizobium mesoamericanum STM3625]
MIRTGRSSFMAAPLTKQESENGDQFAFVQMRRKNILAALKIRIRVIAGFGQRQPQSSRVVSLGPAHSVLRWGLLLDWNPKSRTPAERPGALLRQDERAQSKHAPLKVTLVWLSFLRGPFGYWPLPGSQ